MLSGGQEFAHCATNLGHGVPLAQERPTSDVARWLMLVVRMRSGRRDTSVRGGARMGASGSQYADVPQCPRTEGWTAVCTEQRRGCRLGLDLHGLLSRPSVVYVGTIIVLVIASLRWFGEHRRDSDSVFVVGGGQCQS